MEQDKGRKKRIVTTGQVVITTGQMLNVGKYGWAVEVKYKNGIKAWLYEHELHDISNSK